MEAHLLALRLGHLEEEDVGGHAVLRAAGRRLEHDLVGLLVGDAPAEQLGPPVRERAGVGGVDADALPAKSHGRLSTRRPRNSMRAIRGSVGRFAGHGHGLGRPRPRRRRRALHDLDLAVRGSWPSCRRAASSRRIAVRAMERVLGDPAQTLRTMTAMFAGQVAGGPVEVDVQVLRRGRSMSQLTATVRNPGAEAGLTAIAAFGGAAARVRLHRAGDARRGRTGGRCAASAIRCPRASSSSSTARRGRSGSEIVEGRPVIGRPPWEEFVDGPAEVGQLVPPRRSAAARRRHASTPPAWW